MNSIIELIKTLLGIDSNRRRTERYFAECEEAYKTSGQKQTTKES